MIKREANQRIKKLRAEINHHRYLYHVLDREEISPSALDSLKHELYQLEQQYPEFITSDSPTQRVAGKPLAQFKKVRHSQPIISIEDAFTLEEIADWQVRNQKLLPDKIKGYYGELKMDGLAMVLTYEDGLFKQAVTRGDGLVGEDVTQNLKTVESIPLRLEKIDRALPKNFQVRGEIVITKKELERINRWQQSKHLPVFANPRNLAAGTVRQLDSKIAASRRLDFYAFEILTDLGQKTHQEVHALLKKLGFKVNPHCEELADLNKVAQYLSKWENKRHNLPYQTDGVVIVVDNIAQQKKLGSIGKTERWMLAYKFAAEQATTKVLDITVQVGRTGVLTPVASLEPVKLAGTTVSRATLHNEDEVRRLDVRIGDTVIVQKAGDIIPDIIKVLPKLRLGQEKIFVMPKTCPVCGSPVLKKQDQVAYYCTNKNCFAAQREHLRHFVSKAGFNIEGLGPKIIDQLLAVGLLKDEADLFSLTVGDLQPLERFAEKSAVNLVTAIAEARQPDLAHFITALGIRHVGTETAYTLAEKFSKLDKLTAVSLADLNNISDVGPVVAQSIYDYFQDKKTKKLLERLSASGIKIKSVSKPGSAGKLAGQTVVVTGSLQHFSRDEAKQAIRQAGGKVSESVSAQTDLVVAGSDPGSKFSKAKQLGIKVISEADFQALVK